MPVKIIEVDNKSRVNRFIKFPWQVYKGDPNWVPPLIIDMKVKLNPQKHPYFEHSSAKLFLAEKDGHIAGRIAATVNNNHNRFHAENIGFFSFFECLNDQEVANALFQASADYLKAQKVDLMRGPANWSSNDDWGMLIDAFDMPPVVMMTYNPSYYVALCENFGFKKTMDIYAYWLTRQEIPERIVRVAELLKKRTKITFRTVDMKHFPQEVERIRQVYNSAWSRNWGFVPMTAHEFDHIAKDLKTIINPNLIIIAEDQGRPVGFSMAIPDVNRALIHINGRLLPFGILKLLYYMKKVHAVRVPVMGVVPEYQKRGIDLLFYYESIKNSLDFNYNDCEVSWVLEINEMMKRAAENMGAKKYKTYRLYDYLLT
jgi:hypothetical protein